VNPAREDPSKNVVSDGRIRELDRNSRARVTSNGFTTANEMLSHEEELQAYAESDKTAALEFPPALTGAERAKIHLSAQVMDLTLCFICHV